MQESNVTRGEDNIESGKYKIVASDSNPTPNAGVSTEQMDDADRDPAMKSSEPAITDDALTAERAALEAPPEPVMADDAIWVERAQRGDVEAFERLYRLHVGRIHALCLRMCGDRQEAEEMTQTVFIRAWEKILRFDGRSRFGSWLHRLAVNAVLSAWRSRGRRRQRLVPLEAVEPGGTDPGQGAASWSVLPTAGADAIDLERAIRRLPTGARTVFVLHDIEGYLHREIGELTGMAVGTCKAQLHRARRLLRKSLG